MSEKDAIRWIRKILIIAAAAIFATGITGVITVVFATSGTTKVIKAQSQQNKEDILMIKDRFATKSEVNISHQLINNNIEDNQERWKAIEDKVDKQYENIMNKLIELSQK